MRHKYQAKILVNKHDYNHGYINGQIYKDLAESNNKEDFIRLFLERQEDIKSIGNSNEYFVHIEIIEDSKIISIATIDHDSYELRWIKKGDKTNLKNLEDSLLKYKSICRRVAYDEYDSAMVDDALMHIEEINKRLQYAYSEEDPDDFIRMLFTIEHKMGISTNRARHLEDALGL